MKENSFYNKIKNIKSFTDLKRKIKNKINFIKRHGTFIINNWIVILVHGKLSLPYEKFHITISDVEKIKKTLDSTQELKLSNIHSKNKIGNELEDELYNIMNDEQTWFRIKKNLVFDDFLKKIEPDIKSYLKSPFIVVHLNAWKTKPKMQKYFDTTGTPRGPNRIHNDGYPPGHIKCMIYLQPLDDFSGKIRVLDKLFESEKPGCAVMFDNNLMHEAITGNKNYRYCLELTIMRTVVKTNMLKHYEGEPDDRWLRQAYYAYF